MCTIDGVLAVTAGASLSALAFAYDRNLAVAKCEPLPVHGIPGTNKERTFLAVKPDGVQRGLIGDIIARFEKRGYKLVGLKMVWPTLEMAEAHYADLSSKPFFPGLCKFFSSGPVVCMVSYMGFASVPIFLLKVDSLK